jgi:hypothetical protein
MTILVAAGLLGCTLPSWSQTGAQTGLRAIDSASTERITLGDRALALRDWALGADLWPQIGWTLRYDGPSLRGGVVPPTWHDFGNIDGATVQRAALSSVYFSQVAGLRATGGMLGLTRNSALHQWPVSGMAGMANWPDRKLGGGPVDSNLTLPYVGVGYSNRWLSGPSSGLSAWGISADVGLLAASPRSAVRLGQQALDDTVRDLRLAPVLQLGVSYTY